MCSKGGGNRDQFGEVCLHRGASTHLCVRLERWGVSGTQCTVSMRVHAHGSISASVFPGQVGLSRDLKQCPAREEGCPYPVARTDPLADLEEKSGHRTQL